MALGVHVEKPAVGKKEPVRVRSWSGHGVDGLAGMRPVALSVKLTATVSARSPSARVSVRQLGAVAAWRTQAAGVETPRLFRAVTHARHSQLETRTHLDIWPRNRMRFDSRRVDRSQRGRLSGENPYFKYLDVGLERCKQRAVSGNDDLVQVKNLQSGPLPPRTHAVRHFKKWRTVATVAHSLTFVKR